MSISRAKRYSKKRRRHQTNINGNKSKFKRGFYKPINESKYVPVYNKMSNGLPEYRSSWEQKFMVWLDHSPTVLKWSSEPVAIQYFSSEDQRVRHYYPDFFVEFKDGKKVIVEIKPNGQKTLTRNIEKWVKAEIYCKERGMSFVIMTEIELKSIL